MIAPEQRLVDYVAGYAYGRDATCGKKVDYKSEETAGKSAARMSLPYGKTLEPYQCVWCGGWHIGRAMTPEERQRWLDMAQHKV